MKILIALVFSAVLMISACENPAQGDPSPAPRTITVTVDTV